MTRDEMRSKQHWEKVYSTKSVERLGWYIPHLAISLDWIKGLDLNKDSAIIDVGGGVSSLTGDLLDKRYSAVTVLDISAQALAWLKACLGDRAGLVTWLQDDITLAGLPPDHYDLWHDRAVFHFLTSSEQQQKYLKNLLKSLRSGGHFLIGVFAPEAPPECSGLPVQRYTAEQLENALGDAFELKRQSKELHVTPGGVEQMYLYCLFQKL